MAKALTLSELNAALKPIHDALTRLKEELTTHSTQVSEMHAMVTNISVKLDTLEQTAGATLSEISKPVVKKTAPRKAAVPRKPVTAKPPTKRGTRVTEEPVEDEAEAEEDAEPAEEDAEEEEPATPVNKKAAVKIVTKPPSKAAAKKPAPPRLNKMTIFKDAHKATPSKFDKYLTAKVKKSIDAANSEKWKDMSAEQLANAQRDAYYHHMKDNHNDVLEALKAEQAGTANSEE